MRQSHDTYRLRPASFAVRLRPIMHTGDLTPSLAIAATEPVFDVASEGIARQLRLPICDRGGHACTDYEIVLHYARRADRPRPVLQIRANGPHAPGPLYVDFEHGAHGYRKRQAGHASEPLARADGEPSTPEIDAHLLLFEDDAFHYHTQLDEAARPNVVYLDPMYPERGKSALEKKEMRYLRALVGDDLDAPALLA